MISKEKQSSQYKQTKCSNKQNKKDINLNNIDNVKNDITDNDINAVSKEDRSKNHSLIHVESFYKHDMNISDFFTTKFDYVVKRNMYKPHKRSMAIYDLFRQIMVDKDRNIKTPIITLSPDPSISASTLAGSAEKFMYMETIANSQHPVCKTNLKVIYIDSSPDLSTKQYMDYNDFRNAVLSDVMGINEESFSNHRIDIPPKNITLIGIDEKNLCDEQDGILRKYKMNMRMFTSQIMKRKGVENIMESIIDKLMYENVHVVIDLSCMQIQYAPSVIRDNNDKLYGFDFDQMKIIINCLKKLKRLNGVDITGYNFGPHKDKDKHHVSNMITIKTIEMIVTTLIELKQKSINIFNEESKFLIWRKVDDYDSIGWYILRNVSLEDREELIRSIDDSIQMITIPNDNDNNDNNNDNNDNNDNYINALVTVTTMKEQQEKSYYTASSVLDCCLYPGEKVNMMFELLNTPIIQKNLEKDYEYEMDELKPVKNHYIKIDMVNEESDSESNDITCKNK